MALLHAMLMLPVEHHRRCLWLPTLLSVLLSADFFWTTLRGRLDLFLIRLSQLTSLTASMQYDGVGAGNTVTAVDLVSCAW